MPAVAVPVLQLFGMPAWRARPDEAQVLLPERPSQVLAYLACRRDWVTRDELAEWLFPERAQSVARANLRKVLLLARKLAHLPPIEQQGDRLRWAPDSDLGRFDAACAEERHVDALAWHGAPLLRGFEPHLSPTAAEWLRFERERVAGRWRAALASRLQELAADPRELVHVAETALATDPFDEATLVALVRARQALGEPAPARAALQAHERLLAREMGVEPSAALRALAAELAPSRFASAVMAGPASTPGLPASQDEFVGRRLELQQLQAWFVREGCAVATITGPGGIGKTTVARSALLRLAPEFAGRAWWAPVDDLQDAEQLPIRLVAVLGLELAGGASPRSQICDHIGAAPALLVLDNAEHLPAIAAELETLRSACPGLRLLITSRSRLALPGEWLLPLDGMPLPDPDETDLEVLRSNDAVRLFEARARAASPGFELGAQAADVVRLVHAVEGMPLALDLAAPWVRLLPVAEIVAELLASPELLASTASPLPARERSLGASFDRSWRLLSALERAGLCGLAWLPGSFDRQMAQQVAGAALPILAALMDKSLLRRDGPTRFSIHPLLRQCALRHADDFDELAARHARYVARWMQAIDPRSLSMDAVEAEWPHIRPAWDWALAHVDAGVIAAIAPALVAYCENRGLWGEAVAMLEPAVSALGGAGDRGRAQMLLWRGLAILHYRAGRVAQTETAARNALRLAQRLGDGKVMLSALNTLGLSRWYRGEFPEAESFFAHALRRAEREGNAAARASMLANLALVHKAMGRYEQALQGFANVIANERREGSMRNIVSDLNNIANVYRALLRPAEALAPLHEALALCDAQGLASSRPFVLVNIGLAHFDLGEHDRAAHWVERSLAMSVHAEPHIHASALVARARLRRLAGETAAARHDTEAALEIATQAGAPEVQMLCVAEFGEILVAEGQCEQGAALLLWAAAQKLQNRADRDAAKRAVDALHLEPDAVARCTAALPAAASLATAIGARGS